jgi:Predicted pyridoxal phosphate-dependent enzyme apparently involved in regulation of cell wall biogenesis
MNSSQIIKACNNKTIAIFLSHIQGFSGLDDKLLKFLKRKKIKLIEDVCESHGAKHKGKKLGNYGIILNFSFYYAHHMSTIEVDILSTNNKKIYNISISIRNHSLVHKFKTKKKQIKFINKYKNFNKDFIFSYQNYNFTNNKILGIIKNSLNNNN